MTQAPRGELANRLHSAALHLLRRLRAQDAASGLSGPQASALSVIVYGGPLTLGALAAAEQVRPPTITKLIRALERSGLVRRTADSRDRRRQQVAATARGRRLLEEGRARRVAALVAALRDLDAGEHTALEAAVGTLERLFGPPSPWLTRDREDSGVPGRTRPSQRARHRR